MEKTKKEIDLEKEKYHKTIDEKRILSLGQEILTKIKETNGNPQDYTIVPISTEFLTITQKLSWEINASWKAKQYVGNQSENTYAADSINDVKAKSQNKMNQILNESGPKSLNNFLQKLSGYKSLLDDLQNIPLDCGCSYSCVYPCQDARCRYGKIQCPTCQGRGQTPFYTQNKQDWMTCQTCYGGRNIRCPSCGGHSYMTYLSYVEAHAEPQKATTVPKKYEDTEIYRAIKKIDVSKLKYFVDMEFISRENDENEKPVLTYKGTLEYHVFKIIGPNKEEYYFKKFQKPSAFFEEDPILDPLFDDLIFDFKNKKGSEEKIMNAFINIPILDQALKNYASGFNQNKNLAENILIQTRHLVSSEIANQLGNIGEKSLNKLSPKFTWKTWGILNLVAAILLLLPIFLFNHKYQEEILAYIGIASLVTTALSYLYTKYKQNKVPQSLRRKIRIFVPTIMSFVLILASLFVAEYQIRKNKIYYKAQFIEDVSSNEEFYLIKNSNIRKKPTTKSSIITTLQKGTKLKDVVPYNRDWYSITYNGRKAYIYHSLIEKQ